MYVSPGSALQYWRYNLYKIEPSLFNFAEEFVAKGDNVWDVGANVGMFAFAAAGMAGPRGHVLAIEPDTYLAGLLRRSASGRPSSAAPVEVLPVAIAKEVGIARLLVARRGRSSNHLEGGGTTTSGGLRERHTVLTVTLDWLLERFPAPRVVKIDVVGTELAVLQGAHRLLSETRPTVLVEVTKNRDEVAQLLKSHDYALFDMDLDKADRRPMDSAVYFTLARPPA